MSKEHFKNDKPQHGNHNVAKRNAEQANRRQAARPNPEAERAAIMAEATRLLEEAKRLLAQDNSQPAKQVAGTSAQPTQDNARTGEQELVIVMNCSPGTADFIRRRLTRALGDACREASVNGAYVGLSAMSEREMELRWISSMDPATRVAGEKSLAKLQALAAAGRLGHSNMRH
ncbi:MAG: hypothetical protein ABI583_00215 [Betaproteobacteria bacterium]